MKAPIGLLAVLLTLSSTSLAQTAPTPSTAPDQQTAPTQQTVPAEPATAVQPTDPAHPATEAQQTAPTQRTVPAEPAPTQQTAPTEPATAVQPATEAQQTTQTQPTASVQPADTAQPAIPAQPTAAGSESSTPQAAVPEAASQPPAVPPAPAEAAPSTEAADASAGAVHAASLAPGAKLFLEPMGGFEQFLSESIVKKKVPLVFVKERADADFLVSGGARVKKPGFITGMVMPTRGGANLSVNDARTGNLVFACELHRADEGMAAYYQYRKWADQCAESLHKAMKKK